MKTKAKVIMEAMRDKELSSEEILSIMSKESDAFSVIIDALRYKGFSADEILDILRKMSEVMCVIDEEEKESKLRDMFLEIGIPCDISGYHYLFKAVILYNNNPGQAFTKSLYPAVAKIFGTTWKRVERSIRHAIERAWDGGDIEVFDKYFKNTISATKGKPTSSEFITTCAEWLNR